MDAESSQSLASDFEEPGDFDEFQDSEEYEDFEESDDSDRPTKRPNLGAIGWVEKRQYSYKTLQVGEIRILHLLPGERGQPLRGILEHASLRAGPAPDYEAISYAWGSKTKPSSIELEDDSHVDVTASLFEALVHLRYPGPSRSLWADALCINQDDVDEKSAQVAVMNQIFHDSSMVLVWLGGADETTDAAFGAIEEWSKVPIDRHLGVGDQLNIMRLRFQANPNVKTYHSAKSSLSSFALLLQRPWFSRLWVVQEATVAKAVRIHCGKRVVLWEKFKACLMQLRALRMAAPMDDFDIRHLPRHVVDLAYSTMTEIECRRNTPQIPFSSASFLTTMCILSTRKCEMPHDRIYSLRKFLGLHNVSALDPDYRLSVGEVYRRTVRECFTHAQLSNSVVPSVSLIFGLAGTAPATKVLDDNDYSSLPSWVPNFDRLSENSRRKHDRYCRPDLAQWRWENEALHIAAPSEEKPSHLTIWGQTFGDIFSISSSSECPRERLGGEVGRASSVEEIRPALLEWLHECSDYIRSKTGEDPSPSIKALLCCDDPWEANDGYMEIGTSPGPREEFPSPVQQPSWLKGWRL